MPPAETEEGPGSRDIQAVEVDSLQRVRPRSVGVEQVARWAMAQVGFDALLDRLGFTGPQRSAAIGTVIARMAAPGPDWATRRRLGERSGLGELLEVDFEAMSAMALYRVSDRLLKHPSAIEGHLFTAVSDVFSLGDTVTL